VYKANGDSLLLTSLTWELATSGWSSVVKNKSVSGGTLNIKGVTYANGIGTHAKSVILFALPDGYVRFKATAGLDIGGTSQAGGATVEFLVATQDPTVRTVDVTKAIANTGRISRTFQRAGKKISADITGATKLYLVVTDAGDNYNYDHADWIAPTIYKPNGDSMLLTNMTWVSATSGWASVVKNKSLDGATLKVNGVSYANGLGLNANSIIQFNLPAGYTTFKAFCGFDDEVLSAANGVTVEFLVYTQDPSITSSVPMTLDLPSLGLNGDCLIRNLWAKKDTGTFSGSQFVPSIKAHGAGLYRISALNRSTETSVSLSASASQVSATDTVVLDVTVTGTLTSMPTGSVVITNNDTLVGVVPVDGSGKAAFRVVGLTAGTHVFKAKYSGNVTYASQGSNTVTVDLAPVSTSKVFRGKAKLAVITLDQRNYLSGTKPGDKVVLYNSLGQMLSALTATSDMLELNRSGITLIEVRSGKDHYFLKAVL